MPLLRKQPFHKTKPPLGLRPDDEVFHCSITNEIFKTYDEFFERTILCNSLVWSCSITGRSGLTYVEALESERGAEKRLATIDSALQKPLLFLVTLTQKSRFMDLCEEVFQFANDRYFIGESVDVIIGRQPMPAVILRVQAPPRTVSSKTNGEVIVIDEDSDHEEQERNVPAAGEMMYVVALSTNINKRVMVKAMQISRKKGSYNRDRNKLFLKNKCHSVNGTWCVKDSIKQTLHLSSAKFEDFFAGPRPKFPVSEPKRQPSSGNASCTSSAQSTPGARPQNRQAEGGVQDKMGAKKGRQKEAERSEGRASPQNMALAAELAQQKQQERLEKLAKQLAMKKKFEEERQRLKEERERQREEKEKERQKKLEEKKKKLQEEREWNRPREDMECDDLKPMPEFKELKTRVAKHLCGDALMILEYVNAFKTIFDFEQFFPDGFSWDDVESALVETDQQGPLCDLLQMLMCTVFNLQEAEAGEVQPEATEGWLASEEADKKANNSQTGDEENGEEDDQISHNELIRSAIMTAQFSQLTFGVPLKDTTMDQYTLTEILRLHLMSSGADANQKNARFRYQQRGGYSSQDDPGLHLRKHDPALIRKLQTGNVFDLDQEDKLKLVMTLVQQVMSYAAVRDIVEDAYDKLRVKKYDLKILQWSEARRVREALGASYRREMEERVKEQEYRLQEMARAAQIKKAVDSGLEPPTFPPLENPCMTAEEKEKRDGEEQLEEKQKKEEYVEKELAIQQEIMELQQTNAIYPLGRDRLYRRYWYICSLPALLVEDHELFLPPQDHPRVTQPASAQDNSQASQPASAEDHPQASTGDECQADVQGKLQEHSALDKDINGSSSNDAMSNSNQTVESSEGKDSLNEREDIQSNTPTDKEHGEASEKLQNQKNSDASDTAETDRNQRDASSDLSYRLIDPSQIEPRWFFVDSKESLEQLLSSLNRRGFRESALLGMLQDFRQLLDKTVDSCPVDRLHQVAENSSTAGDNKQAGNKATGTQSSSSRKVVGTTKSDAVSEIMELTLRDALLDIEGRIYAGGLGFMKVKDRNAWRAALENGGYSPLTDEAPFAQVHSKKTKADTKAASSAYIPEEVVARDLAHALVQIGRGVELRYLKPPFGEADRRSLNSKDEKAECQRRAVYERWEESALGCSSLSQVFLHLAALDKSVKWNRSTLKLRCRICRRMRDDDKMLLCDKCDRGHHIYCLKPPLTKIPSGDWFCYTCRPKISAPRKPRRNFVEEEEEEEEEEIESETFENSVEEASDEEEEEVEDSEEAEEIPNDDVCAKCREDGILILCDVCPRSFHLHCAQPPLKKVPKGKWMCHVCMDEGPAGKPSSTKSKAKGKLDSSFKKGSPYSPGIDKRRSGQSGSSRQNTPRNSPLPTSAGKKSGQTHSQKKSTPKSCANGEGPRKRKSAALFQPLDADEEDCARTAEEEMQAAEAVLNDVMEHEHAWPFLKPVDKKVAPDYYDVIETPMDLSTIRSKLREGGYSSPSQLFADVRLVFTNCVKYNLSSAPVFQAGQMLNKYFQSRVRASGLQSPEKSSPSGQSSPAASKKQRR